MECEQGFVDLFENKTYDKLDGIHSFLDFKTVEETSTEIKEDSFIYLVEKYIREDIQEEDLQIENKQQQQDIQKESKSDDDFENFQKNFFIDKNIIDKKDSMKEANLFSFLDYKSKINEFNIIFEQKYETPNIIPFNFGILNKNTKNTDTFINTSIKKVEETSSQQSLQKKFLKIPLKIGEKNIEKISTYPILLAYCYT